jgi:hypothetical protein
MQLLGEGICNGLSRDHQSRARVFDVPERTYARLKPLVWSNITHAEEDPVTRAKLESPASLITGNAVPIRPDIMSMRDYSHLSPSKTMILIEKLPPASF